MRLRRFKLIYTDRYEGLATKMFKSSLKLP